MERTDKIAVSLPSSLLEMVDDERERTGETRSAFVRRAIRLLFARMQHAQKVREYQAGYGRHPETEDEIRAAERAAAALLSEEPWE